MTIKLDEAKAARNEGKKKKPQLEYAGKVYNLPVELPVTVVKAMRSLSDAFKTKNGEAVTDALLDAAKRLLGSQYEDFMAQEPSVSDLSAIVEGIPAEYGISQGNSSASPTSSKSTGARARRPSKVSTGSTSVQLSTDDGAIE